MLLKSPWQSNCLGHTMMQGMTHTADGFCLSLLNEKLHSSGFGKFRSLFFFFYSLCLVILFLCQEPAAALCSSLTDSETLSSLGFCYCLIGY